MNNAAKSFYILSISLSSI